MRVIIVDLDGTLFANDKWVSENFPRVDGRPVVYRPKEEIDPVVLSIIERFIQSGINPVFVTARMDVNGARPMTIASINDCFKRRIINNKNLFLRAYGDLRENCEVKRDVLTHLINRGDDVVFAIDDDVSNAEMFYKHGIQCLLNIKPAGWHSETVFEKH
jgi:FMN phosphatase YigB (HAD superfamily)